MGHSRIALSTRLKTACATLENTLKVRFLGIGFVWAWIYCSFETSALYPERQGIRINADPSWLASATAVVVTFIVTGIAWRTRELERMRWAQFAAPALIATGTALSAVASFAEPPLVFLQYASGIMSGIGSGWLCILWADALSRLEIEQIEVVVPAASLVTLLCTLVFPYIEGIPGVITVASLPLVSGVLLSMSYKKTASEKRASCREDRKAPLDRTCLIAIVRASAMIGVAYFAIGCMSAMSASEDLLQAWWGFDVPTFIGSASGIAMALCFILFSMRIDFASLFRWLTPLLVLALALFPWQEVAPNFISTTITAIADTSMQVIAYLYVISLAKRRLMPIALGLGITQGSVQLGVLTGNLAGSRASELVTGGTLSVFVMVLGLVCLLSFAALLVPQQRTKPPALVQASENRPETSRVEQRCRQLARECCLSAREAEILGYLAKGRSQPYIREELLLSKNTVATHVKHLYQKLDVHSRQEILDMFKER